MVSPQLNKMVSSCFGLETVQTQQEICHEIETKYLYLASQESVFFVFFRAGFGTLGEHNSVTLTINDNHVSCILCPYNGMLNWNPWMMIFVGSHWSPEVEISPRVSLSRGRERNVVHSVVGPVVARLIVWWH